MRRPCIECGVIALKTRCSQCESRRNRVRNSSRKHYQGDYARRARAVRENAVVCWLCGKGAIAGDPWTADHVIAGEPMSDLLPAHRSCNSRRGARG